MDANVQMNFSSLLTQDNASELLNRLNKINHLKKSQPDQSLHDTNLSDQLENLNIDFSTLTNNDQQATDTLIILFNNLFANQNVILVRGTSEPEYFPTTNSQPARIEFAHGFFASALHEISHWCIAGKARRQLADFGYWYAPDGRNEAQQRAFETFEVKPQALECLFTLACARAFRISQDNLDAQFDTSNSVFGDAVFQQVQLYINEPESLPSDAQTLLSALLILNKRCH